MKRKKKRTGSSSALALVLAWLLLGAGAASAGADRKKQPPAYALVAGTVFRDTGMSLAGAEVAIELVATENSRPRKWKAVTDARGEFAVRLPAMAASYKVTAGARGYQPQEKAIQTTGEDRVDVFFRLDPASN
jgi:hypothetical protein